MVQFVPQCPKVHPKITNRHLVDHGSHDNLEKKIMLKPSTFSWLKIVFPFLMWDYFSIFLASIRFYPCSPPRYSSL